MRNLLLLLVGLFMFSAANASAESALGYCSQDGVTVSSDIFRIGFDGVAPVPADDFSSATDSDLVSIDMPSGTANATASVLPAGGGAAKDRVDGSLEAGFAYGIPFGGTSQDTLVLQATGMGSAVESKNFNGNNADAVVEGEARAEFSIDIVAGTDCDTFFNMPALRLLEPHEILLEINVFLDPSGANQLLATLGPGSPAQTILLPEDHSYLIQLNYDYRVPFGVDPPFSFIYTVTLGESPAVPALGTEGAFIAALLMLVLGATAIGVQRMRRAKGTS
jgi:hypothetical protein